MNWIFLKQAQQPGFMFWFLTELFFVAFVAVLLYFFVVKNPKINKFIKSKKEVEED
ncbi:MAG: hypothetical protein ACK4K9_03670 [Bacteroidia bacterium]